MARLFTAMLLFSLLFTGVAQAADPAPVANPRPLTLQEFKEALPVNAEELDMAGFKALQAKGGVVVLDVRSKESFAYRHLKGSVNAPLTDLTEKNLPQLAPDKSAPVVLACDYSFMPTRMVAMTIQAYPVLKASGYQHIYRLNLWKGAANSQMLMDAAQEKELSFEGTGVQKSTAKELLGIPLTDDTATNARYPFLKDLKSENDELVDKNQIDFTLYNFSTADIVAVSLQHHELCKNGSCPLALFRRSGVIYERIPTTVVVNGSKLFELACGGATGIVFTGANAAHLWTYNGGDFKGKDFKDVKGALTHVRDYNAPEDIHDCQ